MGFFFLILYLLTFYFRPGELLPQLVPYSIPTWIELAAVPATFFSLLTGRQRPTFRAPQIYLLFGLFSAILLSRAAQGWMGGTILALWNFGPTALLFFLVVANVATLRRLKILVLFVVLLSIGLSIPGMLAYQRGDLKSQFIFAHPGASASLEDGAGDSGAPDEEETLSRPALRIRALGVLNDPNDLGQALLMALPFLALGWRKGRWARNLILILPAGCLLLGGIYLTHSRGALVGLIVVLVLAVRHRFGWLRAPALAGVLLLLVVIDFSGGRGFSSDRGRVIAWGEGIQMFLSNPVFGVGYHQFTEHHEITAHNSFVLCFAELGLVGYTLWIALLVATARQLSCLVHSPVEEGEDPDRRRWLRAVRLSVYGFLAAGWFLSRTYTPLLYLLLGIATAVIDLARREGQAPWALPATGWAKRIAGVEFGLMSLVYFMIRFSPLLG